MTIATRSPKPAHRIRHRVEARYEGDYDDKDLVRLAWCFVAFVSAWAGFWAGYSIVTVVGLVLGIEGL